MTGAEIQNHYQVLRIERTADERAIKKAYFTLIREFPPDSHPEDFKRIREAYEVLSDPVARERFDNLDKDYAEYGDEAGALLKAVEEAEKTNDEPEVQRMLIELIDRYPSLLLAREKLALSYLRAEAFDRAVGALDALIEREPDQARHHLRKGFALHRLEKPDEAEAELKRAYELKPEDLDVALSYIKFLTAVDKPKRALKIVDKSIERHPEGSPPNVILKLRRVHVLLASAGIDAAQKEIDALVEKARELNDPELFKFISSQLATIAANLFARKEPAQANTILARCVEINPDSLGERPYPATARFDLEDLPKEGQAWLARLTPGPQSATITRAVWAMPIFMILASLGVTALFLFLAFSEPEAWSTVEAIAAAVPVFACALALAWSVQKALEIVTSPLRSFFTIHPLYLIDVELGRVDVYPLFGLTDLQAIHQHTNGVYSHTQITLRFGGKAYSATIRGKDFAEGWLNYLLGCRQRALELMAEGYLDAEHGIELLPPALLTQKAVTSKKRARSLRFYGAVAVVGLGAWAILMGVRSAEVDDNAWRKAVRGGTSAAYEGYLRAMPEGRHVEEAKKLADKAYVDAFASFRAVTKADAPLAKALIEAAEILRAAGETQAELRLSLANNLPDITSPESASSSPFATNGLSTRRAELMGRLNRMLTGAGIGGVFQIVTADLWRGKAHSPIMLGIEGEARADSAVLVADGVPEMPAPLIEWKVRLLHRATEKDLWTTSVLVPMPNEIPLPASTTYIGEWVSTRAVDTAFETLAQKLAQELGLPGAPPSDRIPERARRSPYAR